MAYFKEFPIIRYPSFLTGKNSSLDYVEVANLFRRVKLREDIQKDLRVGPLNNNSIFGLNT